MFLRRLSWRLGRKLYWWGRRESVNDPEVNGEYWLLGELLKTRPIGILLFDVGANKGEWSLRALSLMQRGTPQASIVAFEPCAATRSMLVERLAGYSNVEIVGFAMSATEGEADFFSNGPGAGTNSLNAVSGSMAERVQLVTIDTFVERRGIDRICMIKVDTEGYDFGVLQGARRMLAEGRIELVQFEYNWRWLLNKASLLDVFTLIKDMPYRFGKLTGNSIEFHDKWHFELDRFFENNYVLVLKGSLIANLGRTVRFDDSNCPQWVVDSSSPKGAGTHEIQTHQMFASS